MGTKHGEDIANTSEGSYFAPQPEVLNALQHAYAWISTNANPSTDTSSAVLVDLALALKKLGVVV